MHSANLRKRAAVAQGGIVQRSVIRSGKLEIVPVSPASNHAERDSWPLLKQRVESLLRDSMHLQERLGRSIQDGRILGERLSRNTLEVENKVGPSVVHANPDPEPVDGVCLELTPREGEVLRLIAEGNSSKQVAHALGISFKTAVCHRTKIMQKLNIHETASLVRYAIRCRLVRP